VSATGHAATVVPSTATPQIERATGWYYSITGQFGVKNVDVVAQDIEGRGEGEHIRVSAVVTVSRDGEESRP
jgi:hypothetical protein